MQAAYPLTAADAVLQKTPFSFDWSVWELFWPLLVGARLVLAAPGGAARSGAIGPNDPGQGSDDLTFCALDAAVVS